MSLFRAGLTLAVLASAASAMASPPSGLNLPRAPQDSDYAAVDLDAARLGQLLFYDPILSGNRNISCATCHSGRFGTSDGVALDLGEGGTGMGPDRVATKETCPNSACRATPRRCSTWAPMNSPACSSTAGSRRLRGTPRATAPRWRTR